MIFKTKNNELAIFGQTISDVKKKLIDFNEIWMQGGRFGSSKLQLIPEKKLIKELSLDEAEQQLKSLNQFVGSGKMTYEQYFNTIGKGNTVLRTYVTTTDRQSQSAQGLIKASQEARAAQIAYNESLKQQTLGAKAAAVGMKALAVAGNMIAMWAVTKGIELATKAIDNYIHRVEIAREKLEETVSELESVESQIDDINSKIDELLAKDTLTLTDENDLKRLKEENEQLKIRQAILDAQKAEDVKDLNRKIEDKYNKAFNSGTEVSTDEYGNQITLPSGEDYLKNRIAYAKELIGLNRELTDQEKLDLQSIRDYALEQGQYIMDLTEGYEAVTAEEKEQQKIWNDILADIAYLGENETGTIPDITKRLQEKFSNGVSANMKDSWAKEDNEIAKWIESLPDDDKKIMLECDIDDASLENLKQYLEENKKLEIEGETELGVPPLSISQTISQLNTQLKPAMDSIKSAWQDIFTEDGFALNDIDIISTCESIRSELDKMTNLGLKIDYSAFDDFVKVLSNTESKEEDVERAFDGLATSITNAGLNGAEDFEVMKSALEDLGVVNEDIVAFQTLAQNTDALKESGLDLANSSYAQIEAFAQEKLSAEDTAQGIAVLLYQQMLVANNPLDTLASIQALANLGGKAAETAGVLAELAQIMAQISNLQTWMANNPNADASLVEATLSGLQKRAESLKTKVTVDTDVDYGDIKKSAGSAGSEAGDAYVKKFEEELSRLKDLRDQGKITEKEYLDQLRILYNEFFADKKEYLEQYAKYEGQYLEGKHTCPLLQ